MTDDNSTELTTLEAANHLGISRSRFMSLGIEWESQDRGRNMYSFALIEALRVKREDRKVSRISSGQRKVPHSKDELTAIEAANHLGVSPSRFTSLKVNRKRRDRGMNLYSFALIEALRVKREAEKDGRGGGERRKAYSFYSSLASHEEVKSWGEENGFKSFSRAIEHLALWAIANGYVRPVPQEGAEPHNE